MKNTLPVALMEYSGCWQASVSRVRLGRTVGKARGVALHVCEGLRVASVPAQGNSLGLPIAANVSRLLAVQPWTIVMSKAVLR